MDRVLGDIGDVCLWAIFVGLVGWTIRYSYKARWWRKGLAGYSMVGLALVIIVIIVPSLLLNAHIVGGSLGSLHWYFYTAVATVVFAIVVVALLILTWELAYRGKLKRPSAGENGSAYEGKKAKS